MDFKVVEDGIDSMKRDSKIEGITVATAAFRELITAKLVWYRKQGGSMSGIRIACLEAFMNEITPMNQQLVEEAKQ